MHKDAGHFKALSRVRLPYVAVSAAGEKLSLVFLFIGGHSRAEIGFV